MNYDLNCFGDVVRDITDQTAVLGVVGAIEEELVGSIIPVFTTNTTVGERCAGIGVLTNAQAMSMGIVGPLPLRCKTGSAS